MLQVHHVRVKGGPNGYADFVKDIQSIFGITTEHDMQLAFDCADPMTGRKPSRALHALTSDVAEVRQDRVPGHLFCRSALT